MYGREINIHIIYLYFSQFPNIRIIASKPHVFLFSICTGIIFVSEYDLDINNSLLTSTRFKILLRLKTDGRIVLIIHIILKKEVILIYYLFILIKIFITVIFINNKKCSI